MQINGLIGYYRECFKEDSSDFNLRNLLRLKNEDVLFISGQDELATGDLHRLPIEPHYGESLSKRVEIYQRERILLYGSLFVSGKLRNDGDAVSLFSPLVVNEARIESDEYGHYFTADNSGAFVNEELLSLLLPDCTELPVIDVNRLYEPSFWINLLAESPYEIDCLESLKFPQLGTKDDASRAMRRKHPSLLPISCLAFVERSASSRGVIHELSMLLDREKLSAPLYAIMGGQQSSDTDTRPNYNLVPSTLSKAQKKVLKVAATESLAVVSGPPGTGKSFTIAAAAAEHFTRGESVLIVANSDTALDVIASKLAGDFGLDNLFVRAGQKAVLKEFKQYLDDLLAGYYDHSEADLVKDHKKQLDKLINKIESDETGLEKLSANAFKQGNRAHKLATDSASLWDKLVHKLSTPAIHKGEKLWQISRHFNQRVREKEELATRYLRSEKARVVSHLLKSDRKAVQILNKASRARTSSKQSEYYSEANFSSLLRGFPVWLVTLNTLHRVLPLDYEMFDLVIVDESTQCNISSVLPAFARAKRALVVGDQKQLKHYSFISRSKQLAIADQFGVKGHDKALSYRDASILDMALQSVLNQNQVAFLDEHFRSQPELIHFSNEHFYGGKLKVMQHRPCSTVGHVSLIDIGGIRTDAGTNEKEAEAIVAEVKQIIKKDSELQLSRTIGILSPFSKQAAYLSTLVEKLIPLECIQKHQIKVSTPYGFQGEERDIMLISFCIDDDSKRAVAYLNKPDVFNVSVTRARQSTVLFKSFQPTNLPKENLLRQYIASVDSFIIKHKSEKQPDEFQGEVIETLKSLDIDCWGGYEMLGTYIDVLVKNGDRYLAIDLIGYPGPWENYFELNTYKIIKRAGIEIFPLSYALWNKDQTRCVQAILDALGRGDKSRGELKHGKLK
ncbi:DEAD/DEAH box helicase [Alteromonas gracilis]|uniref:DEAD/DEAH box helicase n=1 Tax=Alteromonas gracilis TaxID=1479524 RepID=UPI0037361317